MTKESILRELNNSIAERGEDIKYVKKLKKTPDKVKYLRIVKGYSQAETAEMIGKSERHVQRVERKLKMSC